MFTISLHLFYCVLNFVKKIITGKNGSSKRDTRFCDYVVAKSSNFEAECNLVNDNISFNPPVYIQRYLTAIDLVKDHVSRSSKPLKVVDFGCAEVSFFEYMKRVEGLTKVLCIDIDEELLMRYHTRAKPLPYNYLVPNKIPFSVDILAGSIAECDPCLRETDIFIAIELIEHLYPHELNAVPWTVFGYIQPKLAVFTTPNVEFNVMFKGLNGFRHDDHKFEWTRREFHDWGENIILRYPNYEVYFSGIGPGPAGTEKLGCVSQMAVFIRKGSGKKDESSLSETSTYKLVKSYEFPFQIDSRSDSEKIRDEVTHHRIRFAYLEPYVDQDVIKIELFKFMPFVKEWCDSIKTLKDVLESFGTAIDTNEAGDLCVIGISDEFIESSEEEFNFENDNDFSNWGTYVASDNRVLSPAWDCAEIPQESWDDWGEVDTHHNPLSIPQHNHPPAPEFDTNRNSTPDLPSYKTNYEITEKENNKPEALANSTEKIIPTEKNSKTTSNKNLGKKMRDKKFQKKRNPLIEFIDSKVNEKAVISVEAGQSASSCESTSCKNSAAAENAENMEEEGVWIISDELKVSKPHRRSYKKYKTLKNTNKGARERKNGKGVKLNQKSSSIQTTLTCAKKKDFCNSENNQSNSTDRISIATNDNNSVSQSNLQSDSFKDINEANSSLNASNAAGENSLNSTLISNRLSNSESGLGSLESLEAQENSKKIISVASSNITTTHSISTTRPDCPKANQTFSSFVEEKSYNGSPRLNSRRKPRRKKQAAAPFETPNAHENSIRSSSSDGCRILNNSNKPSESGNLFYRGQPLSAMNKLEPSSSNRKERNVKRNQPSFRIKHSQDDFGANKSATNPPKNPFMNSILKLDEPQNTP